MARQLLYLIPLIIGSAVVPLQVMMIILLLNSPRQGLVQGNLPGCGYDNCPVVARVLFLA